jgi:hypothetical protein
MTVRKTRVSAIACAALSALLLGGYFRAAESGAPMMYLTVKNYEAGISFRDVQYHAPIGMIVNPCSYADKLVPTIDWNDGKGPHKPDTNYVTTVLKNTTPVPVILNGVYLFWDDSHVAPAPGTNVATTKLVVHCLGDPEGDKVYETKNTIHSWARVPVKSVKFEQNGADVASVNGHGLVDVKITLDSAAPESGTWVKLQTSAQSALNSLPPFYFISPGEMSATIEGLETRKPAANTNLSVSASTVGNAQRTKALVVTP